jgi:hypothetical protein
MHWDQSNGAVIEWVFTQIDYDCSHRATGRNSFVLQLVQFFLNAANNKSDFDMVSLIQSVDNFLENALYHSSCIANYLLNMKSDTVPVEKEDLTDFDWVISKLVSNSVNFSSAFRSFAAWIASDTVIELLNTVLDLPCPRCFSTKTQGKISFVKRFFSC